MFVVEPRSGDGRDEELRSIGVRARVCHGDSECPVMAQRAGELVLELATPDALAPSPVPERVSTLHHEAFDHAVEDCAIVITIPRMCAEVLDRLRTLGAEQLEGDVTVIGPQHRLAPEVPMSQCIKTHPSIDDVVIKETSGDVCDSLGRRLKWNSLLFLRRQLIEHIASLFCLIRKPIREAIETSLLETTQH